MCVTGLDVLSSLQRASWLLNSLVQVIILAERVCDGNAGQVLTPVALHRVDIEEDEQGGEKTHKHQQEDKDLQALQVHVGAAEAEGRNPSKHR